MAAEAAVAAGKCPSPKWTCQRIVGLKTFRMAPSARLGLSFIAKPCQTLSAEDGSQERRRHCQRRCAWYSVSCGSPRTVSWALCLPGLPLVSEVLRLCRRRLAGTDSAKPTRPSSTAMAPSKEGSRATRLPTQSLSICIAGLVQDWCVAT